MTVHFRIQESVPGAEATKSSENKQREVSSSSRSPRQRSHCRNHLETHDNPERSRKVDHAHVFSGEKERFRAV